MTKNYTYEDLVWIHDISNGNVFGKEVLPTDKPISDEYNTLYITKSKYDELQNKVEELEKEVEWVSAKERLPEKWGIYNVFVREIIGGEIVSSVKSLMFDGKSLTSLHDGMIATHWKELPKPPSIKD